MNRCGLFITFFIILFSGCGGGAPIEKKVKEPIVYQGSLACDKSLEIAQNKATISLQKQTDIEVLSTYSTLEQNLEKDPYCYEAILYKNGWLQYEKSLTNERSLTIDLRNDLNNTVSYRDKTNAIEKWLIKCDAFNMKLKKSVKIAPMSLERIDDNLTLLTAQINAVPDVSIRFMGCNRSSNYQCRVTFISKVKNEDNKVQYFWDFGDGAHSKRKIPLHTYKKFGSYTVKLRVVDAQGAEGVATKILKVKKSSKPTALFSTNKERYVVGEMVVVGNQSYTKKSKIVRYQWRFGDGKVSSEETPVYRYSKAGKYYIQLKVCNANGSCTAASKQIIVTSNKHSIEVKKGTLIKNYIAIHGAPSKTIKKEKSSMAAYKYGDIWLLAKRGKISCAVHDSGLSTNLLGQPKKCDWHQKHARRHMVELKWNFVQ